jgi:DegV family protein with EDD domain
MAKDRFLPKGGQKLAEVAIVTDSSACLPEELISKYGIEIVPMEFIYESKVYRDGIDITPADFYELIRRAERLPTTSAPSPGTYFELFKKVAERTKNILVVTPSAKLSHTFESAKVGAAMGQGKLNDIAIEVLDSGTAAGSQGFVALAAARTAALGESLAQVFASARSLMPKVSLIAFIDTLHYLAKGGRVPQVAAWASSLLNIKPIFELLPSSRGVSSLERVRTRPRAIKRLVELLKERTGRKPAHCIVMHTNVLDEAEGLKERMASELDCAEMYIEDFTPVMGVHTGPGLLGVAFYAENENNAEWCRI